MTETVLRGATLIDGSVREVTIRDGLIASIGDAGTTGRKAEARAVEPEIVDLAGYVLLPAAAEPHAHLDKAFLAESIDNRTGDLMGAIDAMLANHHRLNIEETVERAERAARLLATNGYTVVRTHADTTSERGLISVEALRQVKDCVADVIDVEIVSLCGWPVVGSAGADHRALLRDALDAGADLVGGCPHLDGDIERATDELLQIATDHGRPVDLHTDETLDPSANGLAVLARRVLEGFDLGATASHCVSLGQQPVDEQRATAASVAAADISVIVLPHTNLFLQGRGRTPVPRGLTAVDVLVAEGVNVAAGADNLQDPFNPMGRGCPFETASLMVLSAHRTPGDAWHSVSTAATRALGRGHLGVSVGAQADLLAVRAASVREAIAFGPADRIVWRRGKRLG